jgi:hypothetical protein
VPIPIPRSKSHNHCAGELVVLSLKIRLAAIGGLAVTILTYVTKLFVFGANVSRLP